MGQGVWIIISKTYLRLCYHNNHNDDGDLDDDFCDYDNDFWGDDDDVHCKISNICEDLKRATGFSQKAAGADFDF